MIRQQNRLRKLIIVLILILEMASIAGAYAANFYTRTRMGMARHVVYLNGKWEKLLPINSIKWGIICILIIWMIFVYLRYRKRNGVSWINTLAMMVIIVMSICTIYFLIAYSTSRNRAYYILGSCFIIMTMLQHILYHLTFSYKRRGINQ